jgi:AcrR family transcriptional regulator
VNRASYNSPRRQQAAAATREAIIEAAQELFACQGYARTTVAQIAEAARVAANTVYTSVGGKPQLLAAITEGGTGDPDVAETLAVVARTTDPAEVIRLTAAGTRRVNERRAKAVAVLLDSAQADPAAAEMLRVTVRYYRDTLAALAGRLEDLGAVQPPDLNRAADVFWYLFGWTSWRTLITDLGWSWDDAEQWLAQRGVEALLEPARPKPQALSLLAGHHEHRPRGKHPKGVTPCHGLPPTRLTRSPMLIPCLAPHAATCSLSTGSGRSCRASSAISGNPAVRSTSTTCCLVSCTATTPPERGTCS